MAALGCFSTKNILILIFFLGHKTKEEQLRDNALICVQVFKKTFKVNFGTAMHDALCIKIHVQARIDKCSGKSY